MDKEAAPGYLECGRGVASRRLEKSTAGVTGILQQKWGGSQQEVEPRPGVGPQEMGAVGGDRVLKSRQLHLHGGTISSKA